MRPFDWIVVVVYLVWIVYDGLRRSKGTDKVDGYFLANRSLPWWAVGLSVMATQMSAVTIVGTTGQAYLTGLQFIQFYWPAARDVILSLTVVPFFTREGLHRRICDAGRRANAIARLSVPDGRTRRSASRWRRRRSMSVLGWSLLVTVFAICVPMIFYTTLGGADVAWTDVKQMFVVVFGMSAAVVILRWGSSSTRRSARPRTLRARPAPAGVDFRFVCAKRTRSGRDDRRLVLMLSYFGCDQSQGAY